jgi:hypothetical protein
VIAFLGCHTAELTTERDVAARFSRPNDAVTLRNLESESTGLPCAMALTASFARSQVIGFLVTVVARMIHAT